MFAADVVGDVPGAIEGPFTRAQRCFHLKKITPLCAGWFGEVNKGMVVVLKELARLAAAGNLGLSISPLANTDKKGGPTQSCDSSSHVPWASLLSEGMSCTRWGDSTTCKGP